MSDIFDDLAGSDGVPAVEPERALPDGPTEQVDAAITHVPITIQIDQKALLDSWLAGRFHDETEGHIADTVISLVASNLARELLPTVRDAVKESIKSNVETIVRENLEGGVAQVDEWGATKGPTIPLREMIGKAVNDALRKPETRDGYRGQGGVTMVQRVIADEVNQAFKKDLKAVVAEARTQAENAVKAAAGEVIAETIERAKKGLSV